MRRITAGAVLLASVTGAVAYAQDRVPPGLQAQFDFSQRLEYSDNPDLEVDEDSDLFGRTLLGFGLQSIRKVDSFFLNLNADVEEGREGGPTFDTTVFGGTLDYTRDTRNARAALNLRYQEADANRGDFDDEFDENGNVINQNEGTRQSFGFGLEGEVGREAPVGASFSWRYDEVNFRDSDDPNDRDTARNRLDGAIDFRITPRITTSLTARYEDFDSNGGVDRETTGLGTAVDLIVTPVDTVNASLSYDRVERSGDQTGTDEGVSGAIDWRRALSNGSIGLGYSSDVTSNEDGRRSNLNLFRDMSLPRGVLSLSLGVTGSDTLGTDPLVSLDYSHQMATSTLSVGLTQRVITDNDNNEEINTSLRASYDREINNLSRFGVSVSLFNRNELQDNDNDGRRLDISLTYRHDLTADWGLVSGYTYRFSTEDDEPDRSSNTIFVGLERSFSWLP